MNAIKYIIYIFLFNCIVFIPFPFYIFSFQKEIPNFIFEKFIYPVLNNASGLHLNNPEISSDSTSLYIWIVCLFILSIFIFSFKIFIPKNQPWANKLVFASRIIFIYYISLQLMKYGFDKIFKAQFYLPEPNILYSPFGELDKDILFWSTMGVSRPYNIFMGLLEIIPACLLLFKKTRTLGLLISIPVLINIIAINFSFDISVKIYSVFLFCLTLVSISPQLNSFYHFFIQGKESKLTIEKLQLSKNKSLQFGIKIFIIGIIFSEALFPHVYAWNFNDDKQKRPYLHGAYEVEKTTSEIDSLTSEFPPIKRFFIHRKGYLIFQNSNDEMQDYKLDIDTINKEFILTDYQLNKTTIPYDFNEQDSILSLQFSHGINKFTLKGKYLNWKNLPALQNDFHWRVEDVK